MPAMLLQYVVVCGAQVGNEKITQQEMQKSQEITSETQQQLLKLIGLLKK